MARVVAPLLASLILISCSAGSSVDPAQEAASPSPSVTEEVAQDPPFDFDAPIPRRPAPLAAELTTLTADLNAAITNWVAGGTEPGPPARPVLLRSVRQQRIYRYLLDHPRIYSQVRDRLPRRLRAFSEKTILAGTRLRSLVTPLDDPPDWKIHRPAPARRLLRYYRAGERRFNIPWEILASLNFVESRFGRILGPSSAGAMGPMQFMPATWDAYGNGGDINDPHDSIIAAARYLSASGAPTRMWDALFAYNRSNDYVKAILVYARQMMRDKRAFYSYYHWQVYVLTKDGDVQMSGPGKDV